MDKPVLTIPDEAESIGDVYRCLSRERRPKGSRIYVMAEMRLDESCAA
jgi:hypothetical protein